MTLLARASLYPTQGKIVMQNKNVAVFFEIPVTDMARAARFYEAVLGAPLRAEDCPATGQSVRMFDREGADVKGALMPAADGFQPGQGSLVYLDGGADLAGPLSRVEAAGGKVTTPKTQLPEDWGFIAHFVDSEGNRVGLHSMA